MSIYNNIPDSLVNSIRGHIDKLKGEYPKIKYNTFFIHEKINSPDYYFYYIYFCNITEESKLKTKGVTSHSKYKLESSDFSLTKTGFDGTGKNDKTSYYYLPIEYYKGTIQFYQNPYRIEYKGLVDDQLTSGGVINRPEIWVYSTICFYDSPYKAEFKGDTENSPILKDLVEEMRKHFEIKDHCYDIIQPIPPEPGEGEGEQSNGEQTNNPCSNTGQFGGGGTPLKDIKLFLYANNVTKGTIKLSKPQVEVGTFATDWRPNPSDYVERHSPAYKEIKGLAIQHNQNANKKYLEIETADGYAYGVDLWGGDARKLLEQQQAEIEELKKLVQTLETKINV